MKKQMYQYMETFKLRFLREYIKYAWLMDPNDVLLQK